mgnify:CR=1 FL=1
MRILPVRIVGQIVSAVGVDDARIRINEEKEAAMKEVRNEVAKVSLAIAEKVIRKELSSEASQKELVDSLVDKL